MNIEWLWSYLDNVYFYVINTLKFTRLHMKTKNVELWWVSLSYYDTFHYSLQKHCFFICSCYYFSIDRDSNLNGLTGSTQAESLVLCGYTLSMQSKALLTGVTDTQPSVLRILPRITFTCHRGKECSSFGERTPLFIARLLIWFQYASKSWTTSFKFHLPFF